MEIIPSNSNSNEICAGINISHNKLANMIELQNENKDLQKVLTERLKECQGQVSTQLEI